MHCIISFSFNNARVLYVFARKTFNLIDFDAVFFRRIGENIQVRLPRSSKKQKIIL